MPPTSSLDGSAARLAPYVEELREFLASRGLACGKPEDLPPFAEALDTSSLREEMTSLLRSVLYRESERLPRTALLELLAVSVGGLSFEDTSLDLQDTMRRLFDFVNEAARAQQPFGATEPPSALQAPAFEALSAPETARAAPIVPVAPVQTVVATAPTPVLVERTPELSPEPSTAESYSINDRLSAAISHAADAAARTQPPANVADIASHPAAPLADEPERLRPVLSQSRVPKAAPRHGQSVLSRLYWIPGVCLLILAIVVSWRLTRRATVSPHAAAPIVQQRPPVLPTKPSAYGPLQTTHPSEAQVPVTPTPAATSPSSEDDGPVTPSPAPTVVPRPSTPRASTAEHRQASSHMTASVAPNDPHEGVFLSSSGIMASHLISAPAPAYPKLASLTHTEGQVILQVVIGSDGHVESTRILKGPFLLRGAAEHAIRRWRYRPYLVNARPTVVATIVTVTFRQLS